MASGGWVNRRVVADLPETHAAAYREFHYGPVLTANVALRHWRFFDKLGFTSARWFEGLGWQVSVRRNVAFGSAKPLTPDDPIVLTFYIPFLRPDLAPPEQGAAGRALLLSTSYAEFERQIRLQMSEMFGVAGFDARRDIAGIILNRWGHAFCAPQPGFFLGRDGLAPPPEVLRRAAWADGFRAFRTPGNDEHGVRHAGGASGLRPGQVDALIRGLRHGYICMRAQCMQACANFRASRGPAGACRAC